MIISLDGRPLVRSRVFEEGDWELEYLKDNEEIRDDLFNTDWKVYTFGSKGRISAEKDGTKIADSNVVYVCLEDYVPKSKNDKFRNAGYVVQTTLLK